MATYKVIQDIEAEDKFVGPLTLKQFIFGFAGGFFGWLCFFSVLKGFSWALIFFVPPMLVGFFLAFPWSKDQPTEVWLVGKLKFYFFPRRKIWDQSGMEELVTITAPKVEEKPLVDNLSKTEVKSRLKILAQTIDSRGWAIKNAQLQDALNNQRLISPTTMPQEVPIVDINSIPDVFDESQTNTSNIDKMIEQSNQLRKQQAINKLESIRSGNDIPATNQAIVAPDPNYQNYPGIKENDIDPVSEAELTQKLKNKKQTNYATSRMRTISPIADNDSPDMASATQPVVNEAENPTPTNKALSENNDQNIETLARRAKKENKDDGEVIISLR